MTQHVLHSALVLVDIQNDYFPGGLWPVPGIESAADNAARLLAGARERGVPVVHIRHVAASDAAPFFRPGTEGAEIHASVRPLETETVIEKGRPNSFLGTDLESWLRTRGIARLTTAGAMTQMCIDATVRAAADLGFKVAVAADACAAREAEFGGVTVPPDQVHVAILAPLAMSYARVVETAALLDEL